MRLQQQDVPSLSDRLRIATRDLHRAAERAGAMGALLTGRLDLARYTSLQRNLLAIYEALERNLPRAALQLPLDALRRTPALAADLDRLHADGWEGLPLAPAARDYAARLDELGLRAPTLLTAHAYVRYLGDLSGGQVLREVVRRAFSLQGDGGTAFYAFDGDVAALKGVLRSAIDTLPVDSETADAIAAEARFAFDLHIRLFDEIQGPGPA